MKYYISNNPSEKLKHARLSLIATSYLNYKIHIFIYIVQYQPIHSLICLFFHSCDVTLIAYFF